MPLRARDAFGSSVFAGENASIRRNGSHGMQSPFLEPACLALISINAYSFISSLTRQGDFGESSRKRAPQQRRTSRTSPPLQGKAGQQHARRNFAQPYLSTPALRYTIYRFSGLNRPCSGQDSACSAGLPCPRALRPASCRAPRSSNLYPHKNRLALSSRAVFVGSHLCHFICQTVPSRALPYSWRGESGGCPGHEQRSPETRNAA